MNKIDPWKIGKSREQIRAILNAHRTVIGLVSFDSTHFGIGLPDELNEIIKDYTALHDDVKWAIDNSVDGLVVRQLPRSESFTLTYELIVDLNDADYIFWQLKKGYA